MDSFSDWLSAEVESRGWSYKEAGRRGGFASSMFTHIANGDTKPGLDFCQGIARAFDMPLEDVLRLAGILPPLVEDDSVAALMRRLLSLSGPARQQVIDLLTLALALAGAQAGAPTPCASSKLSNSLILAPIPSI